MSHSFHPTSLREYDIRGIIGETLGEADAYAIGRGFGTCLVRAGGKKAAVGYDGRVSSPMLEEALVKGLNDSGADVVRIGMGPTPMLYYAEAVLDDVDGGIEITGSHNPANYNGFKMVLMGKPFFGADILKLGRMATTGDWVEGVGSSEHLDILDQYVARVAQAAPQKAFRIGWDAGNGAAGPAIEKLVKMLPGEHHLLFVEVDGQFPNHHPDPTDPENLIDLQRLVAEKQLDFGVAFDGDGDRIGAIDGEGRVIWGDQLLQIYAADVLGEVPGATIIADVKASQALFDRVTELGGQPMMWKTGHSLIKSKMKETGSSLAGEMSGHIFFKERWFGFDDGSYAGARLLEIVSRSPDANAVLKALPTSHSTPELNVPCEEGEPHRLTADLLERVRHLGLPAPGHHPTLSDIDGVRIDWDDGFGLIRASNTTPVLVLRFEGQTESSLERIRHDMLALLQQVKPGASLQESAH